MKLLYVDNQILELSGSVISCVRQPFGVGVNYIVRVQHSKDFYVDIISISCRDSDKAKKYVEDVIEAIFDALTRYDYIMVEVESLKNGTVFVKLLNQMKSFVRAITIEPD